MRLGGSLAVLLFPFLAIGITAQTTATVQDVEAKLLREPNSGSALLKPLPRGSQITVENAYLDRKWTRVSSGETEGWVRRERIRIKMDDPWKQAAWLFIGSTPKTQDFVVRFYLNTSQIVRYKDNIRFWTRMVPDNKKAYFKFIMDRAPKKKAEDFKFNSELWEGDCDTKELNVVKSLFYWRSNEITRPKVKDADVSTSSNSAARAILEEACTAANR
ncbi:MAG: hypothetical protein DWQ47_09050 [Acidobacteria bacterium]|nr:MAG: hypothetical protein DWQ32_17150 [Acidobacteriota bacterium]REJ98949.1 MAG: hypothetical protein DWQ38_12830 [Acidobacteriota bacterium]REK16331.1 MAG: hypothetical protein DWQ43_04860 [Acidobacteriota bacterium]REK44012.1 MAG: hypothetical protein DWQ47_09050 [Acidobacteriota bacterium]